MNESLPTLTKPYCIGVYVIRFENNTPKYLLMHRSGSYLSGIWQTIWGKVEKGEKGTDAAYREVIEETALIPDRFYSADTLEIFYEPDMDVVVQAPVFVAFIDTDQEVKIRAEEHSSYRWDTFEEALGEFSYSCQKEALRHVHENFAIKEPNEIFRLR